jgi:acetylornithine/succinyldiaminopimelate/putrescine aminotransferase/predicted amino acid dehydrogenase
MSTECLYDVYCKPKLADLLAAIKLDVEFTSAQGNYLSTKDGRRVLDFIGGFGATLLGHNQSELVEEAITALRQSVPVHAQSSLRGESARLAALLNQYTPPGHEYFVHFTNSGGESVEAAIKHAYKVQFDKIRREYERISRVLNEFYYTLDRNGLDVDLPNKSQDLTVFRDNLDEYNLTQFEAFQNNPVMVALQGSFHGKTSSALKVTFNKSYREAYEGLSAIRTAFISTDHPERLEELVAEHVSVFYYPLLTGRQVTLRPIKMTRVIAFIFEILQGEGGMRPVPLHTLQHLAEVRQRVKVPFILDEIQTGCGRLGSVFAYTQTPLAQQAPEYIVLSKALGGGLVKIGAALIRKDIYDQDFGILHTSTFAEDELSSRIAIKTLQLLTRNDGELLHQVRDKSEYLLRELRSLQARYPNTIKDVRGAGLMIGVEFSPLDDHSPFFRSSGKQGVLSLLIASYLLEYHNIRLLAPLSTMLKGNPGKQRLSILRIQPSLTITIEEITLLVNALAEVLEIIARNNEYCLVAHLAGIHVPEPLRRSPKHMEVGWPIVTEHGHIDARAGFIIHPTSVDNLIEYYFPSFNRYPSIKDGLVTWWHRIARFLEPIHVRSTLVSSNGFVVENNLVFVPYLPDSMVSTTTPYLTQEIRDKVQDAVTLAKELGDDNIPVSMVGLGAYTSIVTRNAELINDYEVPVTTGNTYTTALTMCGIIHAAKLRGIDLRHATVAVVGALGNIGSVVSEILAPRVGRLKLVGRPGKDQWLRLKFVRELCWRELLRVLRPNTKELDGPIYMPTGDLLSQVAILIEKYREQFVQHSPSLFRMPDDAPLPKSTGSQFEKALDGLQLSPVEHPRIEIGIGLDALSDCDVIVVATNSPDPNLILPDMVKPGALVCCSSIPSNLSNEFEQNLNRNLAFDGGLAQLPEGSRIDFVGMPGGRLTYGCLAETLLLGFDGRNHSFSKGAITSEQVYEILNMAETYGFSLGDIKLNNRILGTGLANSGHL